MGPENISIHSLDRKGTIHGFISFVQLGHVDSHLDILALPLFYELN